MELMIVFYGFFRVKKRIGFCLIFFISGGFFIIFRVFILIFVKV